MVGIGWSSLDPDMCVSFPPKQAAEEFRRRSAQLHGCSGFSNTSHYGPFSRRLFSSCVRTGRNKTSPEGAT